MTPAAVVIVIVSAIVAIYLGSAASAVEVERVWRLRMLSAGYRITTPMWKVFLSCGTCRREGEPCPR